MEQINEKATAHFLLDACDTFLLDCDGVLWHGTDLIEGISETLGFLRKLGKRIVFVTNNSTKSRRSYLKKFNEMGIEASLDEIYGSSYAAAYYLKHIDAFPTDKKVYVIGSEGIVEELEGQGISWCGAQDPKENMDDFSWEGVQPDPQIGAVVIGFDLHFNYKKLAKAHCYLRYNPRPCHYYATNTDATYPTADRMYPGTGTLVAALTTAIGKEPTVFGKPHPPMLQCIMDCLQLVPGRCCMVGDRLDTDIAFGKNGGLKTLLVLTGVTTMKEALASSIVPDYIASSLAVLNVDKE